MLLLVAGSLAAACGGSGSAQVNAPVAVLPVVPRTLPTPGRTGRAASPSAVRVIRTWSSELRSGHVRRAARLFQLPSELINGGGPSGTFTVVRIHTLGQAVFANETLPCGAQFLSADQRGRYVNALFRLTGRPGPGGTDCAGGAGQTARTNFLIANGRIVEWLRAPSDPGDNAGRGAGSTV